MGPCVPEDAAAVRRIVLTGLAQRAALPDLIGELEPLHPRKNSFPGEVFLGLAADALAWSGASPADPLPLEGIREKFLPEFGGRGRDRRKLQDAVLAAAALRGGAEPDLLDEVAWWQADDFWQYALLAAVAYVRAAFHKAGYRSATHARNWPGGQASSPAEATRPVGQPAARG
jgi:hypothetical protein